MATWIAHLRIAENILNEIKEIERIPFVAGNIAPDSGVPNEDWSSFEPPYNITHWTNEADRKVNSDAFYNKYLKDKKDMNDKELFSFLLGYYTHLLTDIEWTKLFDLKMKEQIYKDNLEKDPKFIWEIKKDWYGQDFEYLKENKDSLFYSCFQHIGEVKDYLDYFPKGAFTNRFKYIKEFYQKSYDKKEEFIYFSKKEMDDFVDDASSNIKKILKLRLVEVLQTCSIDRLGKQISFVIEIDKLKQVYRKVKILDRTRHENDAEHSWHLAMMAIILSEYSNDPSIDIIKVLKILLIHDLVEIDAGDTYAFDEGGQVTKYEREVKAAKHLFSMLPEDQEQDLFALWEEYESQKTLESRFASALDKLQPLLFNHLNDGELWKENNINSTMVFERNKKISLGSETLWKFAQEIIKTSIKQGILEDSTESQ